MFRTPFARVLHILLAGLLLVGLALPVWAGPPSGGLTGNLGLRTPGMSSAAATHGWQGAAARLSMPPSPHRCCAQALDEDLAPAEVTITCPTVSVVDVEQPFTATVSLPEATLPLTYTWEATGQAPTTHAGVASLTDTVAFTWSSPSPQTITVTVSNAAGAAVATHALTVEAALQAGFTRAPASGVAPLAVAFSNTSSGDYTASLWDFGDGITSTLPSPTHAYVAPGVYTVTLTVTGPGGSDAEVRPDCISVDPPHLPEPGPHRTDLHLQNLGAGQAAINLVYGTPGAPRTRRYDLGERLAPRAARTVPAAGLEPAVAGAWAGWGTALATQPLATLVEMRWGYPSGPRAAGIYGGLDPPSTAAYLPCLAAGDGLLSRITVQNLEATEAQVAIHFHDRRGAEVLVHEAAVPALTSQTFDLDALGPDFSASGGYGSARIVSSRKVVAVAVVHWLDAAEAYSAVAAGDIVLRLPGIARRELTGGGWDEGQAVIQNLSVTTATVHVEFVNPDGSLAHALDDDIPPRGTAAYATCEPGALDPARFQALIAALGDDWQGTVRVTSSGGQPLAGLALGRTASAGAGDLWACSAVRGISGAQGGLAFPAVYRQLGGAGERWSVAVVQNTTAVSGTLTVEFYGPEGTRVGEAYAVPLAAGGLVRLDLQAGGDLPPAALEALGSDFRGSMVLTPPAGAALVGANQVYWPDEGRAAAYAGYPLP